PVGSFVDSRAFSPPVKNTGSVVWEFDTKSAGIQPKNSGILIKVTAENDSGLVTVAIKQVRLAVPGAGVASDKGLVFAITPLEPALGEAVTLTVTAVKCQDGDRP
ncbi:MAG: hypothetical protein ACE1ZD_01650, partial [Dehalococcoidia bacterium]